MSISADELLPSLLYECSDMQLPPFNNEAILVMAANGVCFHLGFFSNLSWAILVFANAVSLTILKKDSGSVPQARVLSATGLISFLRFWYQILDWALFFSCAFNRFAARGPFRLGIGLITV